MTALALLLLAATASPPPGFEGELTLKLESGAGPGTVVLSLSPRGLRADVEAQFSKKTFRSSLIARTAEPDWGLALDPVRKTVQRFSLAGASEALRPQQSKVLEVVKLGRESVLDFACEHVRVTDGAGFVAEYWVSAQVLGDPSLAALVNRSAKQPASVEAALAGAGVHGLVLKMEQQNGADRVRLVLTQAISKSVPAAALEVPSDYHLTAGALGPGASLAQVAGMKQLSPEQQRELAERLRENAKR